MSPVNRAGSVSEISPVTLLYKERLETLNDFFVFLNVALFRFDCVIIKYPFLASRTKSSLV